MSISLAQTLSAIGPSLTSSFQGVGGVAPYTYAVLPGGAGGTIATNGVYTAPAALNSDPKKSSDTVRVTDSTAATATASIIVGNALLLFCDILAHELTLTPDRVRLWDQKLFEPTDSGLFIAVSVPVCQAFGAGNVSVSVPGGGQNQVQTVNMCATLDVNIISRGPEARDRKEEVILAFSSQYSEQQQNANSFSIGRLPPNSQFVNLSVIDGAAIPYRYNISVKMQYFVTKIQASQYFNKFNNAQLFTNDP